MNDNVFLRPVAMQPSVGTEPQCMAPRTGPPKRDFESIPLRECLPSNGTDLEIIWFNHIGARKEIGEICSTHVRNKWTTYNTFVGKL
jgi:hypothetical protein